jgi:hypothetical protein
MLFSEMLSCFSRIPGGYQEKKGEKREKFGAHILN